MKKNSAGWPGIKTNGGTEEVHAKSDKRKNRQTRMQRSMVRNEYEMSAGRRRQQGLLMPSS
jgi:hypothetical protein